MPPIHQPFSECSEWHFSITNPIVRRKQRRHHTNIHFATFSTGMISCPQLTESTVIVFMSNIVVICILERVHHLNGWVGVRPDRKTLASWAPREFSTFTTLVCVFVAAFFVSYSLLTGWLPPSAYVHAEFIECPSLWEEFWTMMHDIQNSGHYAIPLTRHWLVD